MLMVILTIWLMLLGIRLGFRVMSFAGRMILGLTGVFVILTLAGAAGVALLLLGLPLVLLVAIL